jgi:hypothetical protein
VRPEKLEILQAAFDNYYQGIGAKDSPPVDRTFEMFNVINDAVGNGNVGEDIFFIGIAAIMRNMMSCFVNVGVPPITRRFGNVRGLRNNGLEKASIKYFKLVRANVLNELHFEEYKGLVNAIMHSSQADEAGFFSCYVDRQMGAGGRYDEGRFRQRYGIIRWEMLNLLFTYMIEPVRQAGARPFGLTAIMEGLGIDDDDDDNAVSVQELIERMALGPSALWE